MLFGLRIALEFGILHDLVYLGLSTWLVEGSTLPCNPDPMQLRHLQTARFELHTVKIRAGTPRKHPGWRCKRFGVIAAAANNGNQEDPAAANAQQQSWKGKSSSAVEQSPHPPQGSSIEQSNSCPRVGSHMGTTQIQHFFSIMSPSILRAFQVRTMSCELGQAPKPLQESQRQCPHSRLTHTSSMQVCACCAAANCSHQLPCPFANMQP
jgi:hypothetical protein